LPHQLQPEQGPLRRGWPGPGGEAIRTCSAAAPPHTRWPAPQV